MTFLFIFIGAIIGILISYACDSDFVFLGWLIGSIVGGVFSRMRQEIFPTRAEKRYKFIDTLLILAVSVARADNYMDRSELYYVKNYLLHTFGPDLTQLSLHALKEVLAEKYNISRECQKYGKKATIQEKLMILQFLFGLAASDGIISVEELKMIQDISDWLGIPAKDFEAVKVMYAFYFQNYENNQSSNNQRSNSRNSQTPPYTSRMSYLENDYKVLEISSTATDDEVKKAYRIQALKHHPDKVAYLGEDICKVAEEKFTKLNQAYERVKKSRGMR